VIYIINDLYLTPEKYTSWDELQTGVNSIILDITETASYCAPDEEYCPTCHQIFGICALFYALDQFRL